MRLPAPLQVAVLTVPLLCLAIGSGCFPQQKPESLPHFTTVEAAAASSGGPLFLDLSGQALAELPAGVHELQGLVKLSLRGGRYGTIPLAAWASGLQWLDVSAAAVTNVPESIGLLSGLTTLYMSDNRLTTLPAGIGSLSELAYLNLDRNQIVALPPELGALKNLRWLRLNGNKLAVLPDEVCQLEALERLYLSDNALTALPADIGALKKLDTLVLRGNDLPEAERERIQSALPACSIEF